MNKNALRSGVILGITLIVLSLAIYIIDYTFMVSIWYFFLIVPVVTIGLTAYFGVSYRNTLEEPYTPFGKAFIYSIICMITSSLLGVIWSMILFNVIDTDLPQMLIDTAVENQEAMMNKFGAPQDQIDEGLEKIQEDMAEGFTIGGQIKGFFTSSLIMSAILSLVAGLFIKKKEPDFED